MVKLAENVFLTLPLSLPKRRKAYRIKDGMTDRSAGCRKKRPEPRVPPQRLRVSQRARSIRTNKNLIPKLFPVLPPKSALNLPRELHSFRNLLGRIRHRRIWSMEDPPRQRRPHHRPLPKQRPHGGPQNRRPRPRKITRCRRPRRPLHHRSPRSRQ